MRDFLVTYLSPKLKLEENTTVNLDNSMSAATINALIAAQPKDLNGYTLTFQFADGTYTLNETLDFSGFRGDGGVKVFGNSSDNTLATSKSVNLDFSGTDGLNGIEAYNNSATIYVYYIRATVGCTSSHGYGFSYVNCTDARSYSNSAFTSGTSYGRGFYAARGTALHSEHDATTEFQIAWYLSMQSHCYLRDNGRGGTLPIYGYYADGGSRVGRYGTAPSASGSQYTENGGAKITS